MAYPADIRWLHRPEVNFAITIQRPLITFARMSFAPEKAKEGDRSDLLPDIFK